jgi:hypothetical protein
MKTHPISNVGKPNSNKTKGLSKTAKIGYGCLYLREENLGSDNN